MGLPNVVVEFKTKATTAVARSERGIVCVVLTDATKTTVLHEYKQASEIEAADWTQENAGLLKDAMEAGASKLYAVRLAAEGSIDDVKTTLDALKFNWICHISDTQTGVASYVTERNKTGASLRIKAIVSGATAPDDMHILNFKNTTVT